MAIKLTRGAPPTKASGVNLCPHAFEEVWSHDRLKMYGWHCPRCGQHRPLRVCAHCKVEYGLETVPDSKSKLCEPCHEKHKAKYGSQTKRSRTRGGGGDNR